MSARTALRNATADDHQRVDRIFSRFELASAGGYRGFLRAIASAHLPVEAALDRQDVERLVHDWPARRRSALILRDLRDLGEAEPREREAVDLPDAAALLGALYVLEGSRLGGSVLKKQVPAGLPRRFLDAPALPGAWRRLGMLLDAHLNDSQKLAGAIASASQIFTDFAAAGLAELEPVS